MWGLLQSKKVQGCDHANLPWVKIGLTMAEVDAMDLKHTTTQTKTRTQRLQTHTHTNYKHKISTYTTTLTWTTTTQDHILHMQQRNASLYNIMTDNHKILCIII